MIFLLLFSVFITTQFLLYFRVLFFSYFAICISSFLFASFPMSIFTSLSVWSILCFIVTRLIAPCFSFSYIYKFILIYYMRFFQINFTYITSMGYTFSLQSFYILDPFSFSAVTLRHCSFVLLGKNRLLHLLVNIHYSQFSRCTLSHHTFSISRTCSFTFITFSPCHFKTHWSTLCVAVFPCQQTYVPLYLYCCYVSPKMYCCSGGEHALFSLSFL